MSSRETQDAADIERDEPGQTLRSRIYEIERVQIVARGRFATAPVADRARIVKVTSDARTTGRATSGASASANVDLPARSIPSTGTSRRRSAARAAPPARPEQANRSSARIPGGHPRAAQTRSLSANSESAPAGPLVTGSAQTQQRAPLWVAAQAHARLRVAELVRWRCCAPRLPPSRRRGRLPDGVLGSSLGC